MTIVRGSHSSRRQISWPGICTLVVWTSMHLFIGFGRDIRHLEPRAERIEYNGHSFDTFTVDIGVADLAFFFRDGNGERFGSLGALKDHVEKGNRQLLFATNGGMFTPDWEPNGLYIEGGQELYPPDLSDDEGNFYLKPNGVFYIGEEGAGILPTPSFADLKPGVRYATQSGPMLVLDGRIHQAFRPDSHSTHIRSGVGIISRDRVVFAISNEPVNFYRFAQLFRNRFGCDNALFLDGTISKMYVPALERNELDGDFGVVIGVSR